MRFDLRNLLSNKRRLLADKKRLGRWGEKRCERFLKRQGLKTLARNFRCKTGEIDRVMVDADGTLVFVEVKTRANEDFGPSESAITYNKKTRMHRAARYFLAAHHIEDRPYRFDVVTIILAEKGQPQIRHYENAFTP
jgi:putative endonuclease